MVYTYKYFRILGATRAIIISTAWIFERAYNQSYLITIIVLKIIPFGVWLALVFAVYAVITYFTPHKTNSLAHLSPKAISTL